MSIVEKKFDSGARLGARGPWEWPGSPFRLRRPRDYFRAAMLSAAIFPKTTALPTDVPDM